jgi:hypothetical protein
MRYLALQLNGEVPRDLSIPIASLDVDGILSREQDDAGSDAVKGENRRLQ